MSHNYDINIPQMENPAGYAIRQEPVKNEPSENGEHLQPATMHSGFGTPSGNGVMDVLNKILSTQNTILLRQKSLESRLTSLEANLGVANFPEIRQDIKYIKASVSRLTGEQSIDEGHIEISTFLPVGSAAAIEALEHRLQNPDTLKSLRDYMLMVKGPTGSVEYLMSQLFTEEALQQFTYDGKHGKRSFVNLRLVGLIYDVFQCLGHFQTDQDIRKFLETIHNRQRIEPWHNQNMECIDSSVNQMTAESLFNNLTEAPLPSEMVIKAEEIMPSDVNFGANHTCICGAANGGMNGAVTISEEMNEQFDKDIYFNLPLGSVEAIEAFERKLLNPNFLACLRQYVMRIKGVSGSPKDVLRHIFKDDAIYHYNFDGVQGKRSFVMLQIMQKVICSVFHNLGKIVIHRDVKRFIEMSHNRQKSKLWQKKKVMKRTES